MAFCSLCGCALAPFDEGTPTGPWEQGPGSNERGEYALGLSFDFRNGGRLHSLHVWRMRTRFRAVEARRGAWGIREHRGLGFYTRTCPRFAACTQGCGQIVCLTSCAHARAWVRVCVRAPHRSKRAGSARTIRTNRPATFSPTAGRCRRPLLHGCISTPHLSAARLARSPVAHGRACCFEAEAFGAAMRQPSMHGARVVMTRSTALLMLLPSRPHGPGSLSRTIGRRGRPRVSTLRNARRDL